MLWDVYAADGKLYQEGAHPNEQLGVVSRMRKKNGANTAFIKNFRLWPYKLMLFLFVVGVLLELLMRVLKWRSAFMRFFMAGLLTSITQLQFTD